MNLDIPIPILWKTLLKWIKNMLDYCKISKIYLHKMNNILIQIIVKVDNYIIQLIIKKCNKIMKCNYSSFIIFIQRFYRMNKSIKYFGMKNLGMENPYQSITQKLIAVFTYDNLNSIVWKTNLAI